MKDGSGPPTQGPNSIHASKGVRQRGTTGYFVGILRTNPKLGADDSNFRGISESSDLMVIGNPQRY
jgi:hypothetical protein